MRRNGPARGRYDPPAGPGPLEAADPARAHARPGTIVLTLIARSDVAGPPAPRGLVPKLGVVGRTPPICRAFTSLEILLRFFGLIATAGSFTLRGGGRLPPAPRDGQRKTDESYVQ